MLRSSLQRLAVLSLGLPGLIAPAFAEESMLNTEWKFLRLTPGVQEPANAMKPGFDASGWESVTLPHTVRLESVETSRRPFQGKAWYRRTVTAKPEWKGKGVSLFFEGAMQVAEVWVNGSLVTKHEGGYLPFTVDLTKALETTGKAVVSVRVDNGDNPLIPPGKKTGDVDFCYFGGIYRNVRLRVRDKIHLTDAESAGRVAGGGVFARYEKVSETSATVLVSAQLENDTRNDPKATRSAGVVFSLRDAEGREVAASAPDETPLHPGEDRTVRANLEVKSPKLWHPDSPYLYTLVTRVVSDGGVLDERTTRLGIRSVAFDNEGFHLNGKPLVLRGANRHQDYPWLGNAVPDNASYRDIRLLREAGYNFLRLCHYPQSQAVMDACDELGMMVSVCTPGWQFYSNDEIFKNHARQNVRDMVRWHRNHPSAVMWEVTLNETYHHDQFYAECAGIAHDEYPGDQMLASGDSYASDSAGYLDIPYPVWQSSDNGNKANPSARWTKAFAREYGDYRFGGQHSTSRVPRSAGEEAMLLQAWNHQWDHNLNMGSPWFGGDCLWAGITSASSFCTKELPLSWWGPIDYYRLPKFSFEFFRSQQSPVPSSLGIGAGPTVFIANYWTPRPSPAKVVVYSNADEVELFLNGKSLGARKPDNGPDTVYGEWHPMADDVYMANGGLNAEDAKRTAAQVAAHKAAGGNSREEVMFDGGNARHIDHAPFTFVGLPYEAGELRAVARREGKVVAEFTRRTPGKPASLRLEVAENGRPLAADGSDVVFVRAVVLDANGTVVPENSPAVKFTVTGAANVVGSGAPQTEAGIASVLIASAGAPGVVTITAETPGLPAAKLDYTVKP